MTKLQRSSLRASATLKRLVRDQEEALSAHTIAKILKGQAICRECFWARFY